MSFRWGPGPVFVWEWIRASRRWQMYALRTLYLGLLLSAVLFVLWKEELTFLSTQEMASLGEKLFLVIVGTQLTMAILIAPAVTASAICLDKTRGAMLHLLVTDLSSAEIVLGKLFTRLIPVLGMILSSLPILLLATFLGGIDPETVLGAYLVTFAVAILGCTLALVLSIWGKKTLDVLLTTYVIEFSWLLLVPIWYYFVGPVMVPVPILASNPYWLAFAPYYDPTSVDPNFSAWFFAVCLLISFALVLIAIWRFRFTMVQQASQLSKQKSADPTPAWNFGKFFGPSLEGNPILWQEWNRKSSRAMQVVWWFYWTLTAFFYISNLSSWYFRDWLFFGIPIFFGYMILCIASAMVFAEERACNNLDALLITPLSDWEILMGKWWGVYRHAVYLVLLIGIIFCSSFIANADFLVLIWFLGLVQVMTIVPYGAFLVSLLWSLCFSRTIQILALYMIIFGMESPLSEHDVFVPLLAIYLAVVFYFRKNTVVSRVIQAATLLFGILSLHLEIYVNVGVRQLGENVLAIVLVSAYCFAVKYVFRFIHVFWPARFAYFIAAFYLLFTTYMVDVNYLTMLGLFLLTTLLLVGGGFSVSLGLCFAVRQANPIQAVTRSATAFSLIVIGCVAIFYFISALSYNFPYDYRENFNLIFFVLSIPMVLAAFAYLLWKAWSSFDRGLGRMPEGQGLPRPRSSSLVPSSRNWG